MLKIVLLYLQKLPIENKCYLIHKVKKTKAQGRLFCIFSVRNMVRIISDARTEERQTVYHFKTSDDKR